MNLLALIFVALFANVLGETAKDLEKLSQEEYTARALAELKAMNKSRFLSDIQSPRCDIDKEKFSIECYLKFKWMRIPRKIAIEISFNLNKLQLKFALLFDENPLFEHKIDLAKICVPLPGLLKQIRICGHAYYVKVDPKPPISFDICFLIMIGDFFHLRLNCVSLDKNGKFSHHARHQPESEGIITISIENGNIKFKLNNPIPKHIMDQIENGWKQFEHDAREGFKKAGRDLDKFGQDVKKEFAYAGKELDKFGKDVKQGFDHAGKELDKFGKNVKQGFDHAGKELDKFGKDVKKSFDHAGKELNKFGKNVEKGFQDFGANVRNQFKRWFG